MADAVPQTERRTPGRVENMVVDAVGYEPVSASKFPANREMPHREVVWVIFGQISSGCLLLLLPLWACGQGTCVVHHVHSDVGRAAYSIRGSVTSPCPALGPTGASRTRMQRPRTATRPEACR